MALPPLEAQPVTRDTICADFLPRFFAVLLDGLILLIPNLILRLAFGPTMGSLISTVLVIVYTVYFWTTSGATPGKMLMGLKVVRAEGGGPLTLGQALLRYFATWLSALPLLLGYLWAIWDPKHETWHDKIAATKVIKD